MGAASSGYNYGANKNSPGNGNGKWQGLWPSVGHARNARLINTRAGGDNRNVVFCMNQLGGVGRISNMFATTADGVQDCKNGCIISSNIKYALQQLTNYAGKRGLLLGLAGVKETVKSDLPNTSGLTPFDKNFSPEMQQYVDLINGLGLEFAVTSPNDVQRHVVVMLTKTDAEKLKAGGYGVPTLCDNIIAYGITISSVEEWVAALTKPRFTANDKGYEFKFIIPAPEYTPPLTQTGGTEKTPFGPVQSPAFTIFPGSGDPPPLWNKWSDNINDTGGVQITFMPKINNGGVFDNLDNVLGRVELTYKATKPNGTTSISGTERLREVVANGNTLKIRADLVAGGYNFQPKFEDFYPGASAVEYTLFVPKEVETAPRTLPELVKCSNIDPEPKFQLKLDSIPAVTFKNSNIRVNSC